MLIWNIHTLVFTGALPPTNPLTLVTPVVPGSKDPVTEEICPVTWAETSVLKGEPPTMFRYRDGGPHGTSFHLALGYAEVKHPFSGMGVCDMVARQS